MDKDYAVSVSNHVTQVEQPNKVITAGYYEKFELNNYGAPHTNERLAPLEMKGMK